MFTFEFSPKTKLSGLKICPKGPDLTESIVPGSKSTSTARGTYLPPGNENTGGQIHETNSVETITQAKTYSLCSFLILCMIYSAF